jgi:CubicO group peptidase (beta-lactamase class C family)
MTIQEQVQETLDELVASGAELGVQVVAYRDGVKVVDTVAGVAAPDGPPVTAGTVFYNFSLGKGAMSTLAHQEPARSYAGAPLVRLPRCSGKGSRRRWDSLTSCFGMPEDKRGSLATLVDAPSEVDWSAVQLPEDLPMFRAAPMSLFPNADLGNDPEVIGADIPAGGKTSARAIAKMYAALLAEVDGLRLISPDGLVQAATLAVEGKDEVFGNQVRWTLGYALGGPSVEQRSETTFGMGGVGGSWAGADTATGTSLAVTKNLLTENFDTAARIARMVFA